MHFKEKSIRMLKFCVKLTISNRVICAEEGSTILQAAKKLGIFIPTFCADDLERLSAKYCMNCGKLGDISFP